MLYDKFKAKLLSDKELYEIIQPNINSQANFITALFAARVPGTENRAEGREDEFKHPLSLIFAFAPEIVCNDIALYLINLCTTKAGLAKFRQYLTAQVMNDSVFYSLMTYAPTSTRNLIFERINILDDGDKPELITHYTGSSRISNFFEYFHFQENGDNQSIELNDLLISYLLALDPNKLFPKLETSHGKFAAFTLFFEKKPQERLSLSMLALLFSFKKEQCWQLLQGNPNLLHSIFANQSLVVIERFWSGLTELFDELELNKLLEQSTTLSAKTAFTLALEREDRREIALFFAKNKFINSSLLLRKEFSSSLSSLIDDYPEILLEFAAKENLQSPFLKKINELISNGNKKSEAYLRAFPIIHFINNYRTYSRSELVNQFEIVKECIRQNPDLLSLAWSEGNTLLHLAGQKGVREIIELVDNAEYLDLRNDSDETPLDLAIINQQVECIPHLLALNPKNAANTPTVELLISNDTNAAALEECLDNTNSELSFAQKISAYCHTYADVATAAIASLCENYQTTDDPLITDLLKKKLQQIQLERNEKKQNSLAKQLIVWLNLLPPKFIKNSFSSFDLNEKTNLANYIIRGLRIPAIQAKLDKKSYHFSMQHIINLKKGQPFEAKQIPLAIFNQDDLDTINPKVLREMAAQIPTESLANIAKKRLHPALSILACEALIANSQKDDELWQQLEQQLANISVKDLNLVLNLTVSSELQNHLLGNFLPKISKQLHLIYKQFNKKQTLLKNSLLRKLLIEHCKTTTENVEEILAATRLSESQQIIGALQNKIENSKADRTNDATNKLLIAGQFRNLLTQVLPLLTRVSFIKETLQPLLGKVPKENSALNQIAKNIDQQLRVLEHKYTKAFLQGKVLNNEKTYKELTLCSEQLLKQLTNHNLLQQLTENEQLQLSLISPINLQKLQEEEEKVYSSIVYEANDIIIENNLGVVESSTPKRSPIDSQQLSNAVIKGLQANKDVDHLSLMIDWLIDYPEHTFNSEIFEAIDNYCQQLGEIPTNSLEKINNLLSNQREITSLNAEIWLLLLESPIHFEKLLQILFKEKINNLELFKNYCRQAKLAEFVPLIEYLITSKKYNFSFQLVTSTLKNQELELDGFLRRLQHQFAQLTNSSISIKAILSHHQNKTKPLSHRLGCLAELTANYTALIHPEVIKNLFFAWQADYIQSKDDAEKRAIACHLFDLLLQADLHEATTVFKQIPLDYLASLIDEAVLGLASIDKKQKTTCRQFLSMVSQDHSFENSERLQLMKTSIGQQDLELLSNPQLHAIAKEILTNNSDDLQSQTFDAVCIQRLITSPKFVACCSLETFTLLIEHYRLLSLSLKQDEFVRLNAWLESSMELFKYYNQVLAENPEASLQQSKAMANDHEAKKYFHLIKKKRSLETFRTNDAVRALFQQLENTCTDKLSHDSTNKLDNGIYKNALDTLYSYYHDNLKGMSNSFFNKLSNQLYLFANQGDLNSAQNGIKRWLINYLPHHNFIQQELNNKKEIFLHNAKGKQIGIVDEFDQILSLKDGLPKPIEDIEEKGIIIGMPLYSQKKQLLGTLGPNGKLIRESVFQKETSAHLLINVPSEELEQSPLSLKLLISDVFSEKTLETLYKEIDDSKKPWLQRQFQQHVSSSSQPISKENLEFLINQLNPHDALNLFALNTNPSNSRVFLALFLQKKELRKLLFSQAEVFTKILAASQNPGQLFADFLIFSTIEQEDFKQGFNAFANYAKNSNQLLLLVQAFESIHKNESIAENQWAELFKKLFSDEGIAQTIWQTFWSADLTTSIQEINKTSSKLFTQYVEKKDFIKLIEPLLQEVSWDNSYRYRLALVILNNQQNYYFPDQELRLSEYQGWSASQITRFSKFIKRHYHQANSLDINQEIANKTISELCLRSANYSCPELLYNNGHFDPAMMEFNLPRSQFIQLVTKYLFLSSDIAEKFEKYYQKICEWFSKNDNTHASYEELRQNQAIADWKKIISANWITNNESQNLSLTTAFLLNYAGSAATIEKLIHDYFDAINDQASALEQVNYESQISLVMLNHPTLDISNCIFYALEKYFTQNPQKLSLNVLNHMSKYFSKEENDKRYLDLIQHFGKQKKFLLVHQCCQLIQNVVKVEENKEKLQLISSDALIENRLNRMLGSFFFFLLKFILKVLPDFITRKQPNEYLFACDDNTAYLPPISPKLTIQTTLLAGREIDSVKKQHKQFKKVKQRLEDFVANNKNNELATPSKVAQIRPSQCSDTIFNKNDNHPVNSTHHSLLTF